MLFGDGVEMLRRVAVGEDHGFTAEASDLRAADVEHVAQTGDVGQRQVAGRACQPVAEPRAVDEERQRELVADVGDGFELPLCIERSVFRGIRNVHHPRKHHVLVVGIGRGGHEIGSEFARIHLPLMSGDCQHLVARVLHGAGFVDADVSRLSRYDALVVAEHRRNDGRIGLRAAGQEKDLGLGRFACLADFLFRLVTVMVHAIPGQLLKIRCRKALQNLRVRPFGIVASK